MEVSVRPNGFTAIVRLSRRNRHILAFFYWIYLFLVVGFSAFAVYRARPTDPGEWVYAPLLLAFPAVAVYHLNRQVYGRDEVIVEGDLLTVRSVGPFGTRTRVAVSDQRHASAYDVVLSGGALRYVVVSGDANRPTAMIRYHLTPEDADRLVALITQDDRAMV